MTATEVLTNNAHVTLTAQQEAHDSAANKQEYALEQHHSAQMENGANAYMEISQPITKTLK